MSQIGFFFPIYQQQFNWQVKPRTSRSSFSSLGQERILDNRLRQSNLIRKLKLTQLGRGGMIRRLAWGPYRLAASTAWGWEGEPSFPSGSMHRLLARANEGWNPNVKAGAQETSWSACRNGAHSGNLSHEITHPQRLKVQAVHKGCGSPGLL